MLMLFAMPIFMVPDETVHFYRAYQVGEGHVSSQTINDATGGNVPQVPAMQILTGKHVPPIERGDYFKNVPDSSVKFTEFPTSSLYSPVSYIPQAIGVDIGRVFDNSLGSMVLMGRLFNLAAYIVLIYIAIRIARQGKWVYVSLALFPVIIQEAASLSTDVMVIGIAFITIALINNLFLQKERINRNQYLLLLLLAAGLGLTKQTSIVLLLPILFLPGRLFFSLKHRLAVILTVLGVCVLALLGWYAVVKLKNYQLDYYKLFPSIGHVDQAAQLEFLVKHPLIFIKALIKTYIFEGFAGFPTSDFFRTSMYGFMGPFSFKLPSISISLGYTGLLLAFLYKDKSSLIGKNSGVERQSLVQLATWLVSVIAIAGALYLVWTPVGATQVAGIQGRYFVPIMPLLIPIFFLVQKWVTVTTDKPYRIGVIVASIAVVNLSVATVLTGLYFR